MPVPYTTNLVPNPSFENQVSFAGSAGLTFPQPELTGYTALAGTTLGSTSANSASGQYAMTVQTDGLQAGEGFSGPMVAFSQQDGPCSMQVALWGETGTLLLTALTPAVGGNPMAVLGQVTVTLAPGWQTVVLNDLVIPSADFGYLIVQTTTAQALTFLADSVQYEPESPAKPYIDGTSPGCSWVGTPYASASVKPFQHEVTGDGGVVTEGRATLITPGEVSQLVPDRGTITSGGSAVLTEVSPVAALDDFALYELTDQDPAMTYASWNTAGLLDGHTAYTRSWGIFYPPLDYPVSDGTLLWPRAAFMAIGMQFAGCRTGQEHNLTGVQVEMLPLSDAMDTSPRPSAYDTPRSLRLIIRPTRLNYSPNPMFSVSTAGWTAVRSGTLTRDTTIRYPGADTSDSLASGKVVCTGAGDGVSLAVGGLITGDTYTASVYALPETAGIRDIQIQAGGTTGGVPGATSAVLPTLNPDGSPAWVRPEVTFTATGTSMTLIFQPVTGGTFPVTFGLAANLIETGEVAQAYFDGDSGNPDYLWEGAEGLSRSYYYQGWRAGQGVVSDILDHHVPLSISAADPAYLVPPTQ